LEKRPPVLKKRTWSIKQQQLPKVVIGVEGERQALEFLQKNSDFQILDTNVRVGNDEVDIIAIDIPANELVFFEVKTRSQSFSGHPSKAITREKLRNMQYVAAIYCKQTHWKGDFRFDVITILPGEVDHFENVTWEMIK
jgi:putative endonuclease